MPEAEALLALPPTRRSRHRATEGAMVNDESGDVRESVKQRYGQAARAVAAGGTAPCCGSNAPRGPMSPGSAAKDPITRDLYARAETEGIPAEALRASFGCGNPTALI